MKDWDFSKPDLSDLGDHDVFTLRDDLKNKRIALVLTGGIAAIKAPFIARMLRRYGADVTVYATETALKFVTVDALEWSTTNKVVTELTSASEHLSDSDPFDAYLIAPATANIINKMAYGIADDAVSTTLASAIGRMEEGGTKVLVAPTMHHTLHTSILTEALERLHKIGVRIIPPREQNGKHNIPHEKVLVSEVCRETSTSPLKSERILVTGGPTPVPIDNVRRITNRFRGRLGICITEELYLRGADVILIHGDGAFRPPKHLPYIVARTYDEYLSYVKTKIVTGRYSAGIFSAGVADFRPEKEVAGKMPSGNNLTLNLVPTKKVIDIVQKLRPDLFMVSFKYQENIELDKLISIAENRLRKGHNLVVANRGEEVSEKGEQIAHLVSNQGNTKSVGKANIARDIADYLAVWLNIGKNDK
jgi:phosphopantothenoylcysteine decarboxylase/phosphopantothenate--cysteine ligase